MQGRCPLCGQALPQPMSEDELQSGIQKLASAVVLAEKNKLEERFGKRLDNERQAMREGYEQKLRLAEERARRDADRVLKKKLGEVTEKLKQVERKRDQQIQRAREDVEKRLEKQVASTIRLATRENEANLEKLQAQRERERVRHEAELGRLQGKLDDLSRKLEKQTGEQLGREAELDLFTELRRAFEPPDKIEWIKKGVKGNDIVHEIRDGAQTVGRIVYERKNTLGWNNSFIAQAKKYQTKYETPHVMVVTRVFPKKQKGLCIVKNTPLVDERGAVALATIIREGVIEIARLRLSAVARDEKSAELFRYIVSDKFAIRFREIVDGVAALRAQQQKERTWHEDTWEAETKLHEQIENRHREIGAQVNAIIKGDARRQVLKLAAQAAS